MLLTTAELYLQGGLSSMMTMDGAGHVLMWATLWNHP